MCNIIYKTEAVNIMIQVDISPVMHEISQATLDAMEPRVRAAHETLVSRTGAGNDFLGWLDLPVDYDKEEFARIQKAAKKSPIPRSCWSSASAAAIWAPGRWWSWSKAPTTTC